MRKLPNISLTQERQQLLDLKTITLKNVTKPFFCGLKMCKKFNYFNDHVITL